MALRRATGCKLEAAGRFVSAVAMGLAVWGLFGLIRRRDGDATAFAAVAALALFPVTLPTVEPFSPMRAYAGARFWRVRTASIWRATVGARWWLIPGWLLVALGLACKLITGFVLVPLA